MTFIPSKVIFTNCLNLTAQEHAEREKKIMFFCFLIVLTLELNLGHTNRFESTDLNRDYHPAKLERFNLNSHQEKRANTENFCQLEWIRLYLEIPLSTV